MTAPAPASFLRQAARILGALVALAFAASLEALALYVLGTAPESRLALGGALLAHLGSAGWCGEALRLRAPGHEAQGRGSFHAMGLLVGAVPLFGFIGCLLLALGRHGAVRVALQRGLSLEQRRAQAMAAA
ncbi:MAG: hypothetical protein ACYC8T_30540, partial [Myxococcaceae bacterium]